MLPMRRIIHNAGRILQDSGRNVIKSQSRCLYEQTKSGRMQFEEKKLENVRKISEVERMKMGVKWLKENFKWSMEYINDNLLRFYSADDRRMPYEDQEMVKFWDFNQNNKGVLSSYPMWYKGDQFDDMNNWYCTCDADFDIGFSKATLEPSPAGYAVFHGYLDNTLPKDGKITRTGYAYMGTHKNIRQQKLVQCTNEFYDMTHICLRVRGDGRRYHIIFDTSGNLDITWFDRYQYPLFTHGGPHWQTVVIPLSKFFYQYQGFVQDEQYRLLPQEIKSVGIIAVDNFSGPFRLEIDYIGFMQDSQWNDNIDYEGYYHESMVLKEVR